MLNETCVLLYVIHYVRRLEGVGCGEHPHRTSVGEINFGCSALTKILPKTDQKW